MARHADIVLPATTTLERNDIGAGRNDRCLIAMHQAVDPPGEARSDYEIFAGLAERLGAGTPSPRAATSGVAAAPLRRARGGSRARACRRPTSTTSGRGRSLQLPARDGTRCCSRTSAPTPARTRSHAERAHRALLGDDRRASATTTAPATRRGSSPPSGRRSPRAAFPLHLIANNPARRLHSQLDAGDFSQAAKVQGREPIRMHPDDAAARGIADGDVVRVFNDRGACLAGAVLDRAPAGVVQLSTGAWYDPDDPAAERLCVHGNVNVLTRRRHVAPRAGVHRPARARGRRAPRGGVLPHLATEAAGDRAH